MEATSIAFISAHWLRSAQFVLIVCLGLCFNSGCRTIEHRVIYNPDKFPKSWSEPTACELSNVSVEDVCFESLDGTRLHGWFAKPASNDYSNVVLFVHGRSGNVSTHKQKLFEFIQRHQVAVFIFDFRGFGKSDGKPSEEGLYLDVAAARNWLASRTQLDSSEIVMMGRSLGVAAAVDLAAREGAKALIVESGFTSSADVLRHHTRGLLSGKRLESCFNSACKIQSFTGPVFISHGKEDKAIPYCQGVRLAQSATSSSRVVFYDFDGGHKAVPDQPYHQALGEFLSSVSR